MATKKAAAKPAAEPVVEPTPAEVWRALSGLPVTGVLFESDGESTIDRIVLTVDWKETEDVHKTG